MDKYSKEELQEMADIADTFEKKIMEFASDVESENSVQAILKGHLYIEHELRELLARNIKNPNFLKIDRIKFSDLTNWVFALGLLPKEIHQAVKKINELRNACAHNLRYTLGVDECKSLEDSLSGDIKKKYKRFASSKKGPINEIMKLQMILFTVWNTIQTINDMPDKFKDKIE
ncbi:hypothetical protein ACUH7Y_09530 [Clostridium beijerinckii]|uniref:DUF4145 domain-containing protein n=1 Tax=Clostridium beijerinckii TaxID=1520 RepID=A0A7X9SME4_CLOBE|nr:hypothetical protein [Clostridium beijerinckii]NMF04553.1 hypothetical protein [Clostridium beijerinckii]